MSTLYVDNLQPNLGSRVSVPGHVIQVVGASYSTNVSTTSTSWAETGLAATITPTSSSSKIAIICHTSAGLFGLNGCRFSIARNGLTGVNLGTSADGMTAYYADTSGSQRLFSPVTLNYLDSPNTTSATTYSMVMKVSSGVTLWAQRENALAHITLMEIAQ